MIQDSKLQLLLAVILAGSMWFYVQHVMIPQQIANATLQGIPRGNLSDLYPRWLGARELLLHGRDPYSAEITREIQIGCYGRPIDPTRPYDPTDQQAFAYPVYIVFLLAPTIALPFAAVQTAFRWLLMALTAASVPVWLRALRWRPSASTMAALIVLIVGSFQNIQGVKLQQLSLLVNGLITFCAFLLGEGQLAGAGILLALATIKPQLALPLAAWLLLWAVSDWHRRKDFVAAFVGTIFVLSAAAEFVLPGWIGRFWQAVIAYRRYNNGAASTLELLLTPIWGRIITLVVLLGLVIVCWRFRHVSNNSLAFNWIMGLILAATVVIVPKPAPYNQVLLLAPALLVVRAWPVLWRKGLLSRLSLTVAAAIVCWPWAGALALTLAASAMPTAEVQRAWRIPLYTSVVIPVVVFALLAFAFAEMAESAMKPGSAEAAS
jgi:Glycosyltransferase family 87